LPSSANPKSSFALVAAKLAKHNTSLYINIIYSSFPTYAAYYFALSNISMPAGAYLALGSRLLDRKALTTNPPN